MSEKVDHIWCTECDVNMVYKGIAMDCPEDGYFYSCPGCNKRIVLFEKEFKYKIHKKYFQSYAITDKSGEKEDYIIRECPICKLLLNEYDYGQDNYYEDIEGERWKDKRLAIPCCNCYNLLTFIQDLIKQFIKNIFKFIKHSMSYPIGMDDHKIQENIVISLYNLGFITESIRNDLLKEVE